MLTIEPIVTGSARNVQNSLRAKLTDFDIIEIPPSIRTVREVSEALGWTIGGNNHILHLQTERPPVPHKTTLMTLLDADLRHHDTIWATAGMPHALFAISPATLTELTGAARLELPE